MILQYASIKRLSQQKIRQQLHYLSFARPMLQPCANHAATLRDQFCDFARRVATLRDPFYEFAQSKLAMMKLFVCTLYSECL